MLTAATDCFTPATTEDYYAPPRRGKYLKLAYWTVMNSYTILYGPTLGYSMFPGSFTHTANLCILALLLSTILFPMISAPAWGLTLGALPYTIFYTCEQHLSDALEALVCSDAGDQSQQCAWKLHQCDGFCLHPCCHGHHTQMPCTATPTL